MFHLFAFPKECINLIFQVQIKYNETHPIIRYKRWSGEYTQKNNAQNVSHNPLKRQHDPCRGPSNGFIAQKEMQSISNGGPFVFASTLFVLISVYNTFKITLLRWPFFPIENCGLDGRVGRTDGLDGWMVYQKALFILFFIILRYIKYLLIYAELHIKKLFTQISCGF